jgi:hypothetical protein
MLLIPTGLLRRLRDLVDHLLPGIFDDVLRHLGFVWDALGLFSLPLALFGVATLVIVALHSQDRLLMRRLPRMRELAAADARITPALTVSSRPLLRNRILKRKAASTSVQIDKQGMAVARPTGTDAVIWDQVTAWRRSGLADWSLSLNDGRFVVQFDDDRISRSDLKKIDLRLALYVTALPQLTTRDAVALRAANARDWLRRHLRHL